MRPLAAVIILATLALTTRGAPPEVPLEVATRLVTSAVAESVTLVLQASPRDERAIVLVGTRLDEAALKSIRQSPAVASELVDEVAARHALDAETRGYLIGAVIGLSLICADYAAPAGADSDRAALQLILGFRRGVRAGIADYQAAHRTADTTRP